MNIGTTMAVEVKLLNKYNKPIVETGPVVVNFPEPVSSFFTKYCDVLSMSMYMYYLTSTIYSQN